MCKEQDNISFLVLAIIIRKKEILEIHTLTKPTFTNSAIHYNSNHQHTDFLQTECINFPYRHKVNNNHTAQNNGDLKNRIKKLNQKIKEKLHTAGFNHTKPQIPKIWTISS
jgi:hypothetical protein